MPEGKYIKVSCMTIPVIFHVSAHLLQIIAYHLAIHATNIKKQKKKHPYFKTENCFQSAPKLHYHAKMKWTSSLHYFFLMQRCNYTTLIRKSTDSVCVALQPRHGFVPSSAQCQLPLAASQKRFSSGVGSL